MNKEKVSPFCNIIKIIKNKLLYFLTLKYLLVLKNILSIIYMFLEYKRSKIIIEFIYICQNHKENYIYNINISNDSLKKSIFLFQKDFVAKHKVLKYLKLNAILSQKY